MTRPLDESIPIQKLLNNETSSLRHPIANIRDTEVVLLSPDSVRLIGIGSANSVLKEEDHSNVVVEDKKRDRAEAESIFTKKENFVDEAKLLSKKCKVELERESEKEDNEDNEGIKVSESQATEYGSKADVNEVIEIDDENIDEKSKSTEGRSVRCFMKSKNFNFLVIIKNAALVAIGNTNINFFNHETEVQARKDLIVERDSILKTVITNDPQMFPDALRRQGSCCGARYDKLMQQMRYFQDTGQGNTLLRYSEKLIKGFEAKGEIDLQVVLLIQRSVLYIYRNDLGAARRELAMALKFVSKAHNNQLLVGRCLTYLGNISLYEKDYVKALEYLDEAMSVLAFHVSNEDKALVAYLNGCVLMGMAAELDVPSESLESKAIDCFDIEIKHAVEDPDTTAMEKKRQFATLKKINVLLRSYFPVGFNGDVPQKNIEKAKALLDLFELKCWRDASDAAKAHFYAAQADYFNCMQQPHRALDIVKIQGAKTAYKIGHEPLLQMIDSRIQMYTRLASLLKQDVTLLNDVSDESIERLLEDSP
ncbi:uncharacterized protein LOC135696625 [Rhopilema esculentum]|uniref:uncharacterized protein LOC135696625 n=1 Tax=Rhopilema esculentum TaxID=499914 RepID=UPI0031D36185|eukprot:gene13069-3851_t